MDNTSYTIHNLPVLEDNPDANQATAGWLLIALPLLLIILFQWIPIVQAFLLSFERNNFFSPSEFIGLENYNRMIPDPVFWLSILNTLRITIFSPNIIYFVVAPLALAFLLIKANKSWEIVLRIISSLIIFCCSSVLISYIYRWFFHPQYGQFSRFPGGSESILANPETAIIGIQFAEMGYGLGIAMPIGLILYLSFLKGSAFTFKDKPDVQRIWSGVWRPLLLMFIVVLAFSLQSFTSSFSLTMGGPANSTTTFLLNIITISLKHFNFGYAAAQQVVLIIILLAAGTGMWFILEKSDIKIWISDAEPDMGRKMKGNWYIVIFILSIILSALVLVIIIFWILSPVFGALGASFKGQDNYSRVLFDHKMNASLLIQAAVMFLTLVFQTGLAFTGGLALGYYRFKGRKIIFFFLCLTAFITPQVIVPQLYILLKNFRLINTLPALILPWFGCPIGIILFKLYFEGVRIESAIEKKQEDIREESPRRKKIIINTILMTVFVLILFFILNINDLMIPWVMISKPQLYTPNMMINYLQGSMIADYGLILAAVFVSFIPVLIMGMVFILLQAVFFPKMKILHTKHMGSSRI
ncbi:MAG: hypothetical protein JXB88_19815 [Spirochaetales bacterium]|nr:hypothetical protein [Spirochaetales bacterium]